MSHQINKNRTVTTISILLITTFAFGLWSCSDDPASSKKTPGPPGDLYVLNQGDATMYVYDTETMLRTDSVNTHVNKPHYIEFAPDGQTFYIVTLETTGRLAKYSTATLGFIDSVSTPPSVQPTAIAITPDGQFGYVCNFSRTDSRTMIHKYNLSTLQIVASALAGAMTHDLKITGDGSVVVATNRFSDDITLLYTDGDTVVPVSIDPDSLYPVGSHKYGPFGVVIDHRDSLAFVACGDALQVRILDIAAQTIVDSIDIPVDTTALIYGPTLLAVSPDNDVVYLTTRGGNSIVAFRVSTMTLIGEIPLGVSFPFGITMSDDGSRVYAACVGSPSEYGCVYEIDGPTFTKVDSLIVGKESFGLIWRPKTP